jgi:hypothetical protein
MSREQRKLNGSTEDDKIIKKNPVEIASPPLADRKKL